MQDAIDPAAWRARRERMKARHPGMGDMGMPLGLAVRLLPTPRTSDTNGSGSHGEGGPDLRTAVSLLPTPRASDGEKASPNQKFGDGSPTLANAAARLLPTPTASDHGSNYATAEERIADGHQAYLSNVMTSLITNQPRPERGRTHWGPYAAAVERWEALTRPAPQPVDEHDRLSPQFVEWLMGLPEHHVTGVPGLSRAAQLKALGNGVVWQQAAAALRLLLDRLDSLPVAA
ncbi:hypothetical protein [Streptomyces sp. NPDC048057]|uniref:hypothetical protein n=1 Tax=Streptomyces sp. NPDC048057 TaxID=3155628 RepID=UPI0033D8662A